MVALNKGEQVPEGWIIDKRRQADDRPEGFLRRRRAADRRRAQGLGPVDRHRPSRRRSVDGPQLRSRRHRAAQQHAVDLHRARRLRRRRAACSREARRFVDWVKASPPTTARRAGAGARRCRAAAPAPRGLRDGVPIDDKTWTDLIAAARVRGHRRARRRRRCSRMKHGSRPCMDPNCNVTTKPGG